MEDELGKKIDEQSIRILPETYGAIHQRVSESVIIRAGRKTHWYLRAILRMDLMHTFMACLIRSVRESSTK